MGADGAVDGDDVSHFAFGAGGDHAHEFVAFEVDVAENGFDEVVAGFEGVHLEHFVVVGEGCADGGDEFAVIEAFCDLAGFEDEGGCFLFDALDGGVGEVDVFDPGGEA